jgi:4-aminobutyrate aminotransferase-like enzyme
MNTLDLTPNRFVAGIEPLPKELHDKIERRERLLGASYRLMYHTPIEAVRGQGCTLIDNAGRTYLDFYNNVTSLGHCHPEVVSAIQRQVETLATNTRYLSETALDFAEKLLGEFHADLDRIMFTCTGSEANDLAMRIAFKHTGATGVIVSEHSYHGTTHLISSCSPNLGAAVQRYSHLETVPVPQTALGFEQSVAQALARFESRKIKPAALLIDTAFTSDGVFPGMPGMLDAGIDLFRSQGGLYIADEVQPGFARTGDTMWGFARHFSVPDLVTLGKPMGNGYPIAALVSRRELLDAFGSSARYFNTFGGNNVAIAAADAVLRVIREHELLARCSTAGTKLRSAIEAAVSPDWPQTELRQQGLMAALEFIPTQDGLNERLFANRVVNAMRHRGVLISTTGKLDNCLKIRPPLIISDTEIEKFADALNISVRDCLNDRSQNDG